MKISSVGKFLMNRKMKNRYLIYFIIAGYLIGSLVSVPLHNTVSAAAIVEAITFEGTTAGVPYDFTNPVGNDFMVSDKSGVENTDFALSSSYAKRGTRSFKLATNPNIIGYWNLTYNTSYLTNVSIWLYCAGIDADYNFYMIFFNKTLGLTANEIIYLVKPTRGSLCYLNEIGTQVPITAMTASQYYEIYVSITNSLGDVQYQYKNVTMDGVARRPSLISAGYRIDCIYLQGIRAGGSPWYFDDLNITISSSYDAGGATGSCDLSGYDHKGSFSFDNVISGYSAYYDTYANYLKTDYKVPVTLTLKGFDLVISSYMVDEMGADALSFLLRINGLDVGYGTELIEFGSGYIVRWCGFDVSLTNETILFVIESGVFDTTVGYWYVYSGYNGFDLDGDGDSETKIDKSPGSYNGWYVARDLAYLFYYEDFEIFPEPNPYTYDNITVPKTSWYTYDEIPIGYFVSNFQYQNTIEVWHNGTQVTDTSYPFPYTISGGDYSGIRWYVPLHIGNYSFKLMRNSVKIESINVTVTWKSESGYALWSVPNPQYYNQKINIGYRYYNPSGNAGMILLGSNANMNSTTQAYRWWQIPANTSGNISITQIADWYIYMYYGAGGVYYRIYDLDIHQQMLSGILPDSINVLYETFTLLESNDFTCEQIIYGHHNWNGYTVKVYLNGAYSADVGDYIDFNITQYISTAKEYVVTLYVETVNGSILIASNSFTITDIPGGEGGDTTPGVDIWDGLFGEYKYVFAIGIVIIFLIMPMTIASKLGIELPMIANLGGAALGLSFCTLSGLLPLYVIFLTAVVMIVGGIVVISR